MSQGNNAAARLLGYVNNIESLDGQIALLNADKKTVLAEAKAEGFIPQAIKQMVKERKLTPEQRRSWAATLQTYRAALGMLDGTPLGDEARRQFFPKPPAPDTIQGDLEQNNLTDVPEAPKAPKPPTEEDIQKAREEGAEACRNGKLITENHYSFDDGRRAAWDEGWVSAADDDDSDGMGIPKAFRPKDKPKKEDPANDQNSDKEAA